MLTKARYNYVNIPKWQHPILFNIPRTIHTHHRLLRLTLLLYYLMDIFQGEPHEYSRGHYYCCH
ncbi:hypothetical protein DERF_005470 [Dermatophagoides farinae]|uniref:Uncharacterized protein n=1 Tax=Dermatophagoides farinae TaxID=6954 RepID=A0A922L675_DERFA|nr:hypothetical protein DERF_005470 [Dermatophagoides farinae]